MTTLTTADTAAATGTRSLRPAAITLFALLVASQIAIMVFTAWEPPFDGAIRYDDVAPISTAYWPMNALLGGPGFALSAVTASIFLAVLGAGRGNVLALAGAGLHLLAGVVFALVITAEVLPFAWAIDPSMMSPEQGRALVQTYNDNVDAFLPYILGSMALVALGALLAMTGAAISGGLSWWVPGIALVLIIGVFALPLGHPFGIVVDLAQRALWIYIGWRGLQSLLRRA